MHRKTVLLVAFVVIALALGTVAMQAVGGPPNTSAQESREIPFSAARYGLSTDTYKVGDTCNAILDQDRFFKIDQQVVVKDADDRIVAVKTFDDGVVEDPKTGTSYTCRFRFSISVPVSDFYTVYLNDERITTLSANQFPINEGDEIRFIVEQEDTVSGS